MMSGNAGSELGLGARPPARRIRGAHLSLGSVYVVVGYILSPLSWWNDLFVNVPLAYLLSYPFSLISKSLFVPSFIAGYWLTNIAGLVLLHRGALHVRNGLSRDSGKRRCDPDQPFWVRYRNDLLISLLYTGFIVVASLLGWLQSPRIMFEKFRALLV